MQMQTVLAALQGTGFTFLMTTLGASLVFFFPERDQHRYPAGFFWVLPPAS